MNTWKPNSSKPYAKVGNRFCRVNGGGPRTSSPVVPCILWDPEEACLRGYNVKEEIMHSMTRSRGITDYRLGRLKE